MKIRDFSPKDFEGFVDCYRTGFPEGHNRYSLSRLVRFQKETILIAEHQEKIVGVIVGITSAREAWLTGLSVLPNNSHNFSRCSMRLIQALGSRLVALGFHHAFATTGRRSVNSLATTIQAELVDVDPNFYFDNQPRWIYKADMSTLQRLHRMLPTN